MSKISTWLTASLILAACADENSLVQFTPGELEEIQQLSPLGPVKPDPTNRYADDPRAAALGQKLFFEKAYAGPLTVGNDGVNGAVGAAGERGKLACASCHSGPWLIDQRSNPANTSLGADWLPRNSSTMVNAAHYEPWYENNGLLDTLWGECIVDIEWSLGFNSSRLRLAHVVFDKYRAEYDAIFPPLDPALDTSHPDASRFPADGRPKASPNDPDGVWEQMTPEDRRHVSEIMANFGKAIAAYLRTLISTNAPFDRFVAGDEGAISEAAKRGLKLFVGKAECNECHKGPHFSDDDYHNTALRAEGAHVVAAEAGRFDAIPFVLAWEFNSNSVYSDDRSTGRLDGLEAKESDKGKWRTKGLRHIAETAPYMHTGQLATLRDVVKFYNDGGDEAGFVGVRDEKMKKLNLTEREIDDLVELLKTFTGEPVAAELMEDTSVP